MTNIIELLRLMKQNYSTDIIYFERIVSNEIHVPVEIAIEENKIKLYHKITCSDKGEYTPSNDFIELANAFIEYNKPTLRISQVENIRNIFSKYNVNHELP